MKLFPRSQTFAMLLLALSLSACGPKASSTASGTSSTTPINIGTGSGSNTSSGSDWVYSDGRQAAAPHDTITMSRQQYDALQAQFTLAVSTKRYDQAELVLKQMLAVSRNPANYFDSGKDWDERRKQGVPTESVGNFNGQPVTILDNHRPSAKFGKSDLVRDLIIWNLLQTKLGKAAAPADEEEAHKLYDELAHQDSNKLFESYDTHKEWLRTQTFGSP